MYPNFEQIYLDKENSIFQGEIPSVMIDTFQFDDLWSKHPKSYHEIMMHGKLVKTPRWQQAYDRDYNYTGRVNEALPLMEILIPLLKWSQKTIDPKLNGVLINWYDGELGHYIGKHRDSIVNLNPNSPIVTISFGSDRIFRLRPYKSDAKAYFDIAVAHGSCIIMPYKTNRNYTHEIVKQKTEGKRISVTIRAFQD